jgi:purine-binding chemotaxis protein CheW
MTDKRASIVGNDLHLSGQHNLVTFRLEQQTYALPIEPIVKINEMVTVIPIPQINGSVEGVINYHGVAVPAINLRRHLGLPAASLGLDTHIIVAEIGERRVGLIVDEVLEVLELADDRIACPDDILPEGLGEAPLLRGLVHTEEGMVLLLDLDDLFLLRQAQALDQAMMCPL